MNILQKILSYFPHFDICSNDGDVYMRRHKLLQCRFGNVYLHHIRRGDRDRCLHDHPWSFVSIVLAGGYFEELMVRGERRRFWRRPGMVMWRPAKTAHRVDLTDGRDAWTLVLTGPRVRRWGFYTIFGWRPFVAGQGSPICEIEAQA